MIYKGIIAITTFLIALITWAATLSYPYLFTEEKKSYFPIKFCAIFLFATLIFIFPIISFCKIAYDMWDSVGASAGSARHSESPLAGVHIWFTIMCFVLILTLKKRMSNRNDIIPSFSALGSFIFFICISISFFYTVPRSGDDLIMLWLFLAPGFIIIDLILFITILVFTFSSIIRQIKANSKGNMINESSLETKD